MTILNSKTGIALLILTGGLSSMGCVYEPPGEHLPARVTVVSDKVCILTVPQGDEKLIRLDINEIGSENKRLLTHTFTPEEAFVSDEQCVATLNYPFRSGYAYTALITLESDVKRSLNIDPTMRNFDARFRLSESAGKLTVTEY